LRETHRLIGGGSAPLDGGEGPHRVQIGEAFMVHCHPQWLRAREIVKVGRDRGIEDHAGAFCYFNRDPKNIRNIPEIGGGGLMDIGCYPITMSRFSVRRRTAARGRRDGTGSGNGHTDRLTSAVLQFPSGQSVFTCSTQAVPYQAFQILGTRGRIEMEIPFNTPPDRVTRLFVDTGADLFGAGSGWRSSRFATSIRFRAIYSRRRCAARGRFPLR